MARMTGTMSRISDGLRPGQHLVEQQQPRLDGQRAGKLQPLAAGDGEARRPAGRAARRGRPRAATSPAARERIGARGRVQMRADRDVLAHGQARERLHDLEGARDAAPRELVRRHAGDVGAVEDDAALARRAGSRR